MPDNSTPPPGEVTALAHEIRTPLGAILGYTDLLLQERGDDGRLCERLAVIQDNARFLLELAESLLACAKADDGRLTPRREVFAPADVTGGVIRTLLPNAQAKALGLESDLMSSVPKRVVGDPVLLRQVLTNLVSNAVRHTREGGVRLSCEAEPIPSGAGQTGVPTWRLRFAVHDTGHGMNHRQVDHLWQPFTQVHASDLVSGGHGLGLWICRRLVNAMGGAVSVSSVPGHGSSFRVELPVHEPEPTPLVPIAPTPVAQRTQPLAGRRVLVVDDVPTNQLLASVLLKHRGASVALANDGAEAVAKASQAVESGLPYDLVLMDIHMPVMDGFEAANRLRQAGYPHAIVACSAGAERRGLDTGVFDAWIEKPFEFDPFVRTIVAALERRAL